MVLTIGVLGGGKGGTLDALYKYWILGQNPAPKQPRWSIMRNVLHWTN